MKVGRNPEEDFSRVRAAREAIGEKVQLFVDANGAYSRKQALAMAARFADLGVTWFEEPVTSDDLEGLRLIRDRVPEGMDIAAGEYGYDVCYFPENARSGRGRCAASGCIALCRNQRILACGRSVRRCQHSDVRAHGSSLHLHPCCAIARLRNIEYFHDHARIENLFFDKRTIQPAGGRLRPDLTRPGMGLEFKEADAKPYAV